jgi:hypothetical protein
MAKRDSDQIDPAQQGDTTPDEERLRAGIGEEEDDEEFDDEIEDLDDDEEDEGEGSF